MANPLPTAKQSVVLTSSGPRVSRIRRDPPAKADDKVVAERNERDAWMVAIGIVTFALALVVVALAMVSYAGWSPRQYTVHV